MPRVAVDAIDLSNASSFRGIGTYVRNLLGGLAEREDFEVVALATSAADLPAGVERHRIRRIAPGRWAAREHDLLLPIDVRRVRADVLMSPGRLPPRSSRIPVVQTLHDVAPLRLGHPGEAEFDEWNNTRPRWTQVAGVVAVSEFTADEGVDVLGLDRSIVSVAPHGIAPAFRPGPARSAEPYLLFVGEYDERKRHDLAFQVVARLAELGHRRRLKVVGRVASWHESKVADLVAAAPDPSLIEIMGYVPVEDLVVLYQSADALVVTSEIEGFGFPTTEAMACGCPVVAFDNSATHEILDGPGTLVPDADVEAMATALAAVIGNPEDHQRLRDRAIRRAADYTWQRSIQVHAQALRAAAAR